MDKFGVGDEFVHELPMSVAEFPNKSYLIKQRRAQFNMYIWNYAQMLNRIIWLWAQNSNNSEKTHGTWRMAHNFEKFWQIYL